MISESRILVPYFMEVPLPSEVIVPSPDPSLTHVSEKINNHYVILTSKTLIGECLVSELRRRSQESYFESYTKAEDLPEKEGQSPCLILLHVFPSERDLKADLDDAVSSLKSIAGGIPFGVLSDVEDVAFMEYALAKGARCYIPTSLTLTVVSQVLRLVAAGGTFVPWTALMQAPAAPAVDETDNRLASTLSSKEVQVVRALRKGTPNKVIAYQLNMCESTVKVHVRNIMKKLNAKSRAQIVYMTHQGTMGGAQMCFAAASAI